MLGIASLLGALFVGSFAALNLSGDTDGEDDLEGASGEEETGSTDNGDLLEASAVDLENETEAPLVGGVPNIVGSSESENIAGQTGPDLIDAGAGDDYVYSGDGNDTIDGGLGSDHLRGGRGDDLIIGGSGDDQLFGEVGDDRLFGHDGDDTLAGSDGNDNLDAGAGNDQLLGGQGNDTLTGGMGSDVLQSGTGDDLVSGIVVDKSGADIDTEDYLNGGWGDDTLIVGNSDIASGGGGEDEFILGEWLSTGSGAKIMDFDAEEDRIVLIYDATTVDDDCTSRVEISTNPDDPDTSDIVLDGEVLASVVGAPNLTLDQIVIKPSTGI